MSDLTVDLSTVGDSVSINIANGVSVYVWWKDEDTIRLTSTPGDLMVDITPEAVTPVEDES